MTTETRNSLAGIVIALLLIGLFFYTPNHRPDSEKTMSEKVGDMNVREAQLYTQCVEDFDEAYCDDMRNDPQWPY